MMKEKGYAYESDGALVVDVKQPEDKKEIPPCIIIKSNGATNYETTDLATIIERVKLFDADEIIYVVDKRQELHFEQVFKVGQADPRAFQNAFVPVDLLEGDNQTAHRDVVVDQKVKRTRQEHQIKRNIVFEPRQLGRLTDFRAITHTALLSRV